MPGLSLVNLKSQHNGSSTVLDSTRQHRILEDLYDDEQLFRIIVPKRFTLQLRSREIRTDIEAGFSDTTVTISNSGPEFSDADVALVLRYRWPEQFKDLKARDVDMVNRSVAGMGNHVDSGVDPLDLDDSTLSEYCHEQIYRDPAKRVQILEVFKDELQEARQSRAAAVEDHLKDIELETLVHIFVARNHCKMSGSETALLLNHVRMKKPSDFMGVSDQFDGHCVDEIFRESAEARTSAYVLCEDRKWTKSIRAGIRTAYDEAVNESQRSTSAKRPEISPPHLPSTSHPGSGDGLNGIQPPI